jgi:protein transport protein SEC23
MPLSLTHTTHKLTSVLPPLLSSPQGGAATRDATAPAVPPGLGRFLVPLSECEFQLSQILDELQPDAFPTVADNRPNRCTGAAMQVAVGLLGAGAVSAAGRCLLFVGACVVPIAPPTLTHTLSPVE